MLIRNNKKRVVENNFNDPFSIFHLIPNYLSTYAGIKNAEKNWDKPWQGWGEAFIAIKMKYVFCWTC